MSKCVIEGEKFAGMTIAATMAELVADGCSMSGLCCGEPRVAKLVADGVRMEG
jgi:hypothetical protein